MKHLARIRSYIRTLCRSDRLHALVLQSPPGWAKSTTIEEALKSLEVEFVAAGSYATPLHIYNLLCRHPESVIVFDDCNGVFEDIKAMSILKAAAWSSSGTAGARKISWGTTSAKADQESAVFNGKLILIANSIPQGKETRAFLSRSIFYEMYFSKPEMIDMLRAAAASPEHFSDTRLATEVCEFLIEQMKNRDHSNISLRTLHVGCELAATQPEDWRELLEPLLPPSDGENLIQTFSTSLSPKEQEQRFMTETGLSRRTFYKVKKELGLSRPYRRPSRRRKPRK